MVLKFVKFVKFDSPAPNGAKIQEEITDRQFKVNLGLIAGPLLMSLYSADYGLPLLTFILSRKFRDYLEVRIVTG